MRHILSLAVLLLTSPAWAAPPTAGFYGCPWNADGLANFEIGRQEGRAAAYRFRASHSGPVDKVMTFLIFRAPGYFAGNGGQVRLELQDDDGTPGHSPAGKALAWSLVTDPMQGHWNRLFTFDHPPQLTAGRLYHLVFTNPAPDPVHNYVSVDDLHNRQRTPHMQPGVADLDLAVLCKLSAKTPWAINFGHTPIFCLDYADGTHQGQGYRDAASQSGVCVIGGTDRVAEVFTVTGGNRTVSSVAVRVRRVGDSGDLRVQLEQADGTVIEQVSLTAATVPTEYGWSSARFQLPRVLEAGKTYRLALRAESGAHYETYPLQDGKSSGFDTPNLFNDGHFEQSTGVAWQPYHQRADFDMQFYFTLAASNSKHSTNAN